MWIRSGGGNPGTPAYVGGICIILRRQKNTSGYICITPLLVKLAYFLPPKKIWCDTYVSFFRQETSTFARRAAQRHTAGRIRTFSSVLSELFLCALPYFVPSQLLASSPLLQIMTTYVRTPASVTPASFGNILRSAQSLLLAELSSFANDHVCC